MKSLKMETSIDLEQIYTLNHSDWRKIEKNKRPQKKNRDFFWGVSSREGSFFKGKIIHKARISILSQCLTNYKLI